MCRKVSFLVCIVLFCAGTVVAAVPIDDPKYNLSFEWHWPDCCGVVTQIYGHTGIGATVPICDPCDPNKGVWNWLNESATYFAGVDVFCPYAYDTNTHCHQWPASDGIAYIYLQHSGTGIYQVLDGNDPNAIITAGRKYTMKFDGLDEGLDGVRGEFYSASGSIAIGWFSLLPEILLPTEYCDAGVNELEDTCEDWHRDLTVSFIALEGDPFLNQTLSIRFEAPTGARYAFIDNVRLEWMWLTGGYYPYPEDGAEDVERDVTLHWTPGLWATDVNAHEIYFGSDKAAVEAADRFDTTGVFRGVQDRDANTYSPDEIPLVLGKTYYWRIDEVNEAYAGPPAAAPDANGRWKGDIWSFEATGFAINPDPADGAEDVPFVGTVLSWTPGTDSNSHDVYFGTDEDAVSNATTSVTLGVFVDNFDINSYDPGALMLGDTYYWRIDEVNEITATFVKGKVWSFTVANFLPVEDFDSYVNPTELRDVWKDYWTNGSGAEVLVEKDANFTEDGNSMMYEYENHLSPYYSEAYADIATLGITSDWTVGGLVALGLLFKGDYDNAPDDMYVALTDGGGRTGKVLYDGDPNNLKRYWFGFQEWNIELTDFVAANSVDLENVDRLTIGFGDKSLGGTGTVWFENIRLYPPRCVPDYATSQGSFRYLDNYAVAGAFEPDCIVDNYDLWAVGSDWLISGIGDVTATTAGTDDLLGHWTLDDDIGSGSPMDKARVRDYSGNLNHGYLYDGYSSGEPKPGSTGLNHTTDCVEGTGALTFDGFDDWITVPNYPNINSNTVTVSAWVKPDALLGQGGSYPPIVACNEPNGFKLCFGSTATYLPGYDWSANNELGYYWTGWAWDHHSELIIPPELWSFVALVVEPTKGTLYLYDGLEMSASKNEEPHAPLAFNDIMFIGATSFDGTMDDVYFYDRSLSPAEVLGLAGLSGMHHLGLEPWRTDPDGDDEVNFRDFAIMADNWLEEILWP